MVNKQVLDRQCPTVWVTVACQQVLCPHGVGAVFLAWRQFCLLARQGRGHVVGFQAKALGDSRLRALVVHHQVTQGHQAVIARLWGDGVGAVAVVFDAAAVCAQSTHTQGIALHIAVTLKQQSGCDCVGLVCLAVDQIGC